jgi:hypothetical protein
MSDLHWTGAAVLLALAVLGGESRRPRRAKIPSWADLAREHDLVAEPQAASVDPSRLAVVRVRSGRPHGAPTRLAS